MTDNIDEDTIVSPSMVVTTARENSKVVRLEQHNKPPKRIFYPTRQDIHSFK